MPTIVKTKPRPIATKVTLVDPTLGKLLTVGTSVLVGTGVLVGFLVGVAEGVEVGPGVKVAEGVVAGRQEPVMVKVRGLLSAHFMISVKSAARLMLESAPVVPTQSKDNVVLPADKGVMSIVAMRVSVVVLFSRATLSSQLLMRALSLNPPKGLAEKYV